MSTSAGLLCPSCGRQAMGWLPKLLMSAFSALSCDRCNGPLTIRWGWRPALLYLALIGVPFLLLLVGLQRSFALAVLPAVLLVIACYHVMVLPLRSRPSQHDA